jgi:8-oxo-dGTP pyrophosphatase MutT (NUDIX family)
MSDPPAKPHWTTLEIANVYQARPWLSLEKHRLLTPDGSEIHDWHVVQLPSFVNVLARLEGGDFLLLRQCKYLCQPETLATIGGLIDEGETPRQAAERELLEEAGCRSDCWQELGEYVIDPNRGCGRCYLFLADQCRRVELPQNPDREQFGELLVSERELFQIAMGDQVKSLAWATCMLKGLLWLQQRD